jgi:hypothetical protein
MSRGLLPMSGKVGIVRAGRFYLRWNFFVVSMKCRGILDVCKSGSGGKLGKPL